MLLVATGVQSLELPRIKTVEPREPIVQPADPQAPTVAYRRFLSRLNSDKIGVLQTGGLFGCNAGNEIRATNEFLTAVNRDLNRALRRELENARYPRPGSADSAFATPNAPTGADYELGATLKDMVVGVCTRDKIAEGGAWLQFRWELFSPKLQKVVFESTTEGSAQAVQADRQSLGDLMSNAMTSAVRQLLADPAFAEKARKAAPAGAAGAATAAGGPTRLTIARRAAPSTGSGVQDRIPQLQSAVVTLLTGSGMGSGFYINSDGYLLTNHHVVGDAKYLKVKLANGRELVGEVLRSDRKRDVALVKTEPVQLAPFEMATTEAQAGEDVYVLGSPLGEQLAQTVTRGVLSATREVEQQRWLQSDVRVLPGSSGGPMVGKAGAVVGITSRGLGDGSPGINFFVPIAEALAILMIDYQGN